MYKPTVSLLLLLPLLLAVAASKGPNTAPLSGKAGGNIVDAPEKKQSIMGRIFQRKTKQPAAPTTVPAGTEGHPDASRVYDHTTVVERLVAIGDLHGDLAAYHLATQRAGVADAQGNWNGGKTVVVQVGDNCDRGPDCLAILQAWFKLRGEARNAGGDVVLLLGNHEIMCMTGYLIGLSMYVTEPDFLKFGGNEQRVAAFGYKGILGRELFELPVVVQIGGTVFSHAGITSNRAKLGIDGINQETAQHLARLRVKRIPDPLRLEVYQQFSKDTDSPAYTRFYEKLVKADDPSVCIVVDEALTRLNAVRMVIGHSPNSEHKIEARCRGKFYGTDVMMSRYMKMGEVRPDVTPAFLEILHGDQVEIHNLPAVAVAA